MFKILIYLIAVFATVRGAPRAEELVLASDCVESACVLPDCRCMFSDIPNDLDVSDIPQMVLLTFDDAVTAINYAYYEEAFFSRTNPDGCSIGTTYFVSHEYSDYAKVHNLHARGHEIALHSITHDSSISYWDNLDTDGFMEEFGGERELIANFANIPLEDMQGLRVPLLELAGNNSFETLQLLNMKYDSSWGTQTYRNPPLWPYTLDYKSDQDCPVGKCPTASFPGIWVQPMVDWEDDRGYVCSMVDSCTYIPTDTEGILAFLKRNFHRHYDTNKAPFGFFVHAAWFQSNANHYTAYLQLLDYMQSFDDVYIVGIQKALEWIQNPQPLSSLSSGWTSCHDVATTSCTGSVCALSKDVEMRYMTQCKGSCPKQYPWLGNPLGTA